MDRIITLIILYYVLKKFFRFLTKAQAEKQKPGHHPTPPHAQKRPQQPGHTPIPQHGQERLHQPWHPSIPQYRKQPASDTKNATVPASPPVSYQKQTHQTEDMSHPKPSYKIHGSMDFEKQAKPQEITKARKEDLKTKGKILRTREEIPRTKKEISPQSLQSPEGQSPIGVAFNHLSVFQQGIIMSEILRPPLAKRNLSAPPYHKCIY